MAGRVTEKPPGPPLAGVAADWTVAVLVELEGKASAAALCCRNRVREQWHLVVWLDEIEDATRRLRAIREELGL